LKNLDTGGSQKRFQSAKKELLEHNWTHNFPVLRTAVVAALSVESPLAVADIGGDNDK